MLGGGTVIGGKYRLERLVGAGAMATIWSAVHLTLGRRVAIKCVRADVLPDPEAIARFLREARTAAAIRHPFVIDIFDVGLIEDDGSPYMVMELLEGGGSLADRFAHGPPMAAADFVELVVGLLGGLHAAHQAGVIHRDLKPGNIVLAHDAEGRLVPKLVDFGISLVTGASHAGQGAERITKNGFIVGTPLYMSPEQVRGQDDLDPRADLFSMGVIIFEAMAGGPPHEAGALGELMIKIATEDAVPLEMVRPEVGQDLSDVVATAMARDREERFADAAEMRDALQALAPLDRSLMIVTGSGTREPRPRALGSTVGRGRVEHTPVPLRIARLEAEDVARRQAQDASGPRTPSTPPPSPIPGATAASRSERRRRLGRGALLVGLMTIVLAGVSGITSDVSLGSGPERQASSAPAPPERRVEPATTVAAEPAPQAPAAAWPDPNDEWRCAPVSDGVAAPAPARSFKAPGPKPRRSPRRRAPHAFRDPGF